VAERPIPTHQPDVQQFLQLGPALLNVTPSAFRRSNVITIPPQALYSTLRGRHRIQLLKNRLGLDFAYYDRKTTNDSSTPPSHHPGYGSSILNIGELETGASSYAHCTPSER